VAARGIHLGAIGYVNKDTAEFKENLAGILQKLSREGRERRRAKEVEELVQQQPSIRHQLETVLGDLKGVLPEARGTFVSSIDGLPLAVSKDNGQKDVDVLSAMATASVLKNLDVIGGTLDLAGHEGGIVQYHDGSLVFHKVEGVGNLVVILNRQGSWREDGKEVAQAVREIEEVIMG
jgi:predicted regulator of Ras-like GTPase activity (Roadblock/LC7/MglB family)